MAIRYTDEQKQAALESIEKIGISKTSKEMKISTQTLYKWRDAGKANPPTDDKVKKARALLKDDSDDQQKIAQLEAENGKLREKVQKLKKALMAFIEE